MRLLCHLRGDADILGAWFAHYAALGVSSFHLVVHGSREDNHRLEEQAGRYPVVIEDRYEGPFHTEEKARRLNAVLERLDGDWVVLVDSDEFLELPVASLRRATRLIAKTGADVLSAPLVQRLSEDGTLETPEQIPDPMSWFPWCSVDLYRRMGSDGDVRKYPLFRREGARLRSGGNHVSPRGGDAVVSRMRAVTHHFKWRRASVGRIQDRAASGHAYAHESGVYLEHLRATGGKLPLDGAFRYSRRELFKRKLLRSIGPSDVFRHRLRKVRRAVRSLVPLKR